MSFSWPGLFVRAKKQLFFFILPGGPLEEVINGLGALEDGPPRTVSSDRMGPPFTAGMK